MTSGARQHTPFVGCIADDVTGATDLASNLVAGGMSTVQVFGVPSVEDLSSITADAIVIALKSRSIEPATAITQSLQSLDALKERGVQRFYFKYCSTFDSTPRGNIGPVAEALMDALDVRQTIFCPAFPTNGRTVYQGHLFVNGQLLHESGMENHPLNPMKDANLLRVLQEQTAAKVGLLSHDAIECDEVGTALDGLAREEVRMVVADACNDRHLQTLGQSLSGSRLVTGGSALARDLARAWRETGALSTAESSTPTPTAAGRTAILSGSCSPATNRQVKRLQSHYETVPVDITRLMESPDQLVLDLCESLSELPDDVPAIVYSTAEPQLLKSLQDQYGTEVLAAKIEELFGLLAKQLVNQHNVRSLIVAGGETSGAVCSQLGIRAVRIGNEVCPGVPWVETLEPDPVTLILKSGNFGSDDFFLSALELLQ